MNNEPYLTVAEAARLLDISSVTLRKYCHEQLEGLEFIELWPRRWTVVGAPVHALVARGLTGARLAQHAILNRRDVQQDRRMLATLVHAINTTAPKGQEPK